MKKSSKIILITVLTLGVAGGVFAFGAHHHYSNMSIEDKADLINYRVSRKLDLTDIQQANLEALTAHFAGLIEQARENQQSRQEFMNQMLTDQPMDQAAMLQRINEKTALVNEKAPEVVALLAGFVDSLDAEQKAEIKQMIEHRRGHRFGRHGYSD